MSVLPLFRATEYEPVARWPPTRTVEANSKGEAAAKLLGCKLRRAPLASATMSVVALGEPRTKREYFPAV